VAEPIRVGAAPPVPIARGPITPAPPVVVRDGWEVSARRSSATLRLVDCSALAKVLVRADPSGAVARDLGVRHGRAARDRHGTLVIGAAPGEWLLLARPGAAAEVAARVQAVEDGGLVSVLDLVTHGGALMRLTGAGAARLLAKLCALDLAGAAAPDGTALRGSVAGVATDVIRDDRSRERSYLLHCERSLGQYLFDALLDAGGELGIEPDGFTGKEI
jgi:heterotetrameric sarcosine oxidase gamma subunit